MSNGNDKGLRPINVVRPVILTLSLLSIPLLAMLFQWQVHDPGSPRAERVNWDYFDFIVMGALIFGVSLGYEILAKKFTSRVNRLIVAITLFFVFCIIWAELAVGIFGTPFAGS